MMSAADEDTELRDLLVQTLDKNGVLGKIKAELRASIFLALEAQEQNKTPNPLRNTNLQKLISTEDGQMCIGIINEFLEHFHLDYTAAVFGPESNIGDGAPSVETIKSHLKLAEKSERLPLLLQIIQSLKLGPSPSRGLESQQIQFLRSKFHAFDHTSLGSIDRKDVATVISHACPQVNAEMIDRFVADELKNAYSSTVTFDAFLNLFQKFYIMCSSVLSVGSQSRLAPLVRAAQPPVDKSSEDDSYYTKQPTPFHQVPASPTPLPEPECASPPANSSGIPSAYLMPTNSLRLDGGMDVSYDPFFDTPLGEGARRGTGDPTFTHTDTPAISPDSSKASNDRPRKAIKIEESLGQQQQQYEDDFNSERSITEDIQDMGDDLLQSSDKEESLDLTEDRTVSEIPHADYMEDIRHG